MPRMFSLWIVLGALLPASAGCTMFSNDGKRWSTGWGTSHSETSPRTDL